MKPQPKRKPVRNKNLPKGFHEFCVAHEIGCLICRSPEIQIHHGIYKSQQGSDEWKNLYPLCPRCHTEVHYYGKESYYIIKEIKEELWGRLEEELKMDLSMYLD